MIFGIKGILKSKDMGKENGKSVYFWNEYKALITLDPKEQKPRLTWFDDGQPIGHLILPPLKNFKKFQVKDKCFTFGQANFKS